MLVLVVLAELSGEDGPSRIADRIKHRREQPADALGPDLVCRVDEGRRAA